MASDGPAISAPPSARRAGEVSLGWRWTVGVAWAALVACLIIVAGAAEVINRSVWWIGNRGDRVPFVLALVPFIAPAVTITAAARSWRSVVAWSFVASASTILIALGDLDGSPSAAVLIASLGVAGLLVSVAATSGRTRA